LATQETQFSFSKTSLTSIQPTDKRTWYRDAQTVGLAICVTPAGSKVFYVVRRVAGMGRKGTTEFIRLGAFPDDLTVEQARAAARDKLRTLNAGESVRAAATARKDELTVNDLWDIWKAERAVGPNPDMPLKRSWSKDQRLYDCHLKSRAKRRLSEISPAISSKIFSEVTISSGPVEANHVKRLARAMWNHVTKHHGIVVRNPWTTIKDNAETPREQWVSPDQMPALFRAIDSIGNQDAADLIRLCLFTGARSGNVKAMRWDQLAIANATWTISSAHHKNKRIHTIPLAPPAQEILRNRQGMSKEWVFPSSTSKSGHLTKIYGSWELALAAFAKELGLENPPSLRIHDLRHTTASWMASQGDSLPMVGKLLGHITPQTTARYAHLGTDPVREALNRTTAAMIGEQVTVTHNQPIPAPLQDSAIPNEKHHKQKESALYLVEKLLPGDSMVQAIAEFILRDDRNQGLFGVIARYHWHYNNFNPADRNLNAHKRNPVWIWKTLEYCNMWGCPVPYFALEHLRKAAEDHAGYGSPTEAHKRRAREFEEAFTLADHGGEWGKPSPLERNSPKRKEIRDKIAEEGDSLDDTARRLLDAVEQHMVEWQKKFFEHTRIAHQITRA
jgi:integrase